VFTKDLPVLILSETSMAFSRSFVNYPSTFFDLNVPFGGKRKSGIGRVFGRSGIMSFNQIKSVFWNLG
jgi:acyl-CoA reductase-like NAD-dependent aldehyde dehydrogenase